MFGLRTLLHTFRSKYYIERSLFMKGIDPDGNTISPSPLGTPIGTMKRMGYVSMPKGEKMQFNDDFTRGTMFGFLDAMIFRARLAKQDKKHRYALITVGDVLFVESVTNPQRYEDWKKLCLEQKANAVKRIGGKRK